MSSNDNDKKDSKGVEFIEAVFSLVNPVAPLMSAADYFTDDDEDESDDD